MCVNELLESAAMDGVIFCEDCGNGLEPDADKCYCGWLNPLVELGWI